MNRKYLKIAIIAVIIIGVSYFIVPVSYPLIFAFFVALILTPLVNASVRMFNVKRSLAVITIFLVFLLFILAAFYLIITQLISQGVHFFENFPEYIVNINEGWNSLILQVESTYSDFPEVIISTINDQITYLLDELRSRANQLDIISMITAMLARIPVYFISFLVFLIALFLFMNDMPRIQEGFFNLFSDRTKSRLQFMIRRFSQVISGFLKAQFIVSIPIFIISLIGLFIIVPEVALIMALVIWIIDFIPLIGSIVILAPWASYLLLIGDTSTGVQLFVLAGILLIIRRTVEPKIMGQQIGLSPLATLISMYLGAQLIGVAGLLIGPLTIIAFTSAKEAGILKSKS